MPRLETLLRELSTENKKGKINKNFRLILTTMPTKDFPANLLQKSVKVIAQPPGGLNNSLLGIYANIINSKEETIFYESSNKPEQ